MSLFFPGHGGGKAQPRFFVTSADKGACPLSMTPHAYGSVCTVMVSLLCTRSLGVAAAVTSFDVHFSDHKCTRTSIKWPSIIELQHYMYNHTPTITFLLLSASRPPARVAHRRITQALTSSVRVAHRRITQALTSSVMYTYYAQR